MLAQFCLDRLLVHGVCPAPFSALYRYNHLSALLTKVLTEKSEESLSRLEDASKTFKREKFSYKEPFIRDNPGKTPSEVLAHSQWQMMKVTKETHAEIRNYKT